MRPRVLLVLGLVLGAMLLQVSVAQAAAPSNDTSGGAIAITSLPYSNTQDTTEATTDADDATMNANCGAPSTDASVWYTVALASDTNVLADVSQSNYSAGVLVAEDTIGNIVSCAPGGAAFFAAAGHTYYLLIIDDQSDGSGNGGNMVLNVDVAPPPPVISLTIDPVGSFNSQTGEATVKGTTTCSGDGVEFAEVDGSVQQRAGRVIISGSFFTPVDCDGATHPWTAVVHGDNGLFKGGRAQVQAFAFACSAFDCGSADASRTVALKGSGGKK